MAHATMTPRTSPHVAPRTSTPVAPAAQAPLTAHWVRVTGPDGRARLEMRWGGRQTAQPAMVPAARAA